MLPRYHISGDKDTFYGNSQLPGRVPHGVRWLVNLSEACSQSLALSLRKGDVGNPDPDCQESCIVTGQWHLLHWIPSKETWATYVLRFQGFKGLTQINNSCPVRSYYSEQKVPVLFANMVMAIKVGILASDTIFLLKLLSSFTMLKSLQMAVHL